MNKSPERIELLAAEYVLGSLRGPARRRFEGWMMESGRVRHEVWFWEQKLGALSNSAEPEQPPADVWLALSRRLWPDTRVEQGRRPEKARWFWPGWGLVATAAAIVLAVMLVQRPLPGGAYQQLAGAVVQASVDAPLWLVSESGIKNQLRLRPIAASVAGAGKDYELWVVPEQGQPLSLGVLPVGRSHQIVLSDQEMAELSRSRTLAISLEPSGGSPTGAPTGPILHVTKLYEL